MGTTVLNVPLRPVHVPCPCCGLPIEVRLIAAMTGMDASTALPTVRGRVETEYSHACRATVGAGEAMPNGRRT
ncbi:hypothetical protein GCM10010174_61700 [Kutzneria viridogrisea]